MHIVIPQSYPFNRYDKVLSGKFTNNTINGDLLTPQQPYRQQEIVIKTIGGHFK